MTKVCCTVLLLISYVQNGVCWTYSGSQGPSHWVDTYSACGGTSQSPINLEGGVYDSSLGNITFTNYATADMATTYTLHNNGHTINLELESSTVMSISNGGLPGTYKTFHFHLHWGNDASDGSEHTKDGNAYVAELHLVHYKDIYPDILTAVQYSQGLAVLGILIQQGSTDNPNFNNFINLLSTVRNSGATATATRFALADILPSNTAQYYRYSGSLTTPGCFESVIWTVFNVPISLSENQLNALRSLFDIDGAPMVDNFRPIQALNDRVISASWDGAEHVVLSVTLFAFAILVHFI